MLTASRLSLSTSVLLGAATAPGRTRELSTSAEIDSNKLLEITHETDCYVRLRCRSCARLLRCRGSQGMHQGSRCRRVAGHLAGHGKLGAAAGCAIGHHEANKAKSNKTSAQAQPGQK